MKTIHVVAALIRKGEYVYATQRGYGDLKGGWEFPGGKIQEGETPQEALVREIQEELETEIAVGKHFQTVEYDYPTFHLTMECYWCSVIQGDLILKEHLSAKWLKAEDLRSVEWLPADETLIDRLEKEGYGIRNLIFDIGDVLIQYRWQDMLMDYGMSEEESNRVGTELFSDAIWTQRFDRGTISHQELEKYYAEKYPEDESAIRWFIENAIQMKVDRPEVWKEVRKLKEKGYQIYLLSNYSDYMFHLHTKDADFIKILDGKVISYEPNYVKPEPEIYWFLFEKYNLKANECLFFDDRLENVLGAHREGMDAIQVTSREMIGNVLHFLNATDE